MTRLALLLCSLLVVCGAGLAAYPMPADCGKCAADGKRIAAQLDRSKTTLAKAVVAAEEHSKGRAISVISDLHANDQFTVHVYCIAGDPPRIMKCYFDHASGTVQGMKEVEEFPITKDDHGKPGAAGGPGAAEGGHGSAVILAGQTVEAGCGACIYKMPGVTGCPLAIRIDGKPYLVEGATWPNHDYCDRHCQAVVSGRLEGDKFIATSLKEKK